MDVRQLKDDSHELRLTHAAALEGSSAEFFSNLPHHILQQQPHVSNAARVIESLGTQQFKVTCT